MRVLEFCAKLSLNNSARIDIFLYEFDTFCSEILGGVMASLAPLRTIDDGHHVRRIPARVHVCIGGNTDGFKSRFAVTRSQFFPFASRNRFYGVAAPFAFLTQ